MAEYFRDRGQRRADRHRRSDQARRHASRAGAADPRAAGARGLSRRHLLPPCPPARTRREAVAGAGRRLADRAADRRDRCRQSVRLHPDQPDLDHRRPDRARYAPVRRQPAAGGRCRAERQPGRRQGAEAGAARGLGPHPARLCPVPRTGDVHPLRRHFRHARQGADHAAASASARCSPSRASPLCASPIEVALLAALGAGVFDDLPADAHRRCCGRGSASYLDAHAARCGRGAGENRHAGRRRPTRVLGRSRRRRSSPMSLRRRKHRSRRR